MKLRIACAAIAFLLGSGIASARTCRSLTSGPWSSPSTWTNCLGVVPGPSDSASIEAGHTVTYDINTTSGDTVYEVVILEGATLHFPPGEHRIQMWRPDSLTMWVRGRLSVANGTIIAFRADTGWPGFGLGNEGQFDSNGVSIGPLRKLEAFTRIYSSPACGGGELWELSTSTDVSGLVPGDLVQFATGGTQGRMYEGVSLPAIFADLGARRDRSSSRPGGVVGSTCDSRRRPCFHPPFLSGGKDHVDAS